MTKKVPSYSVLMKYKNKDVVDRYTKDFEATREFSKEVFTEMLKFLWLAAAIKKEHPGFSYPMYHDMLSIDYMWHTFILFTKDYTDFSNKYFGHYIHHIPTTKEEKKAQTQKAMDEKFITFFDFTYDKAGPETIRTWFSLPNRELKKPLTGLALKNREFKRAYKQNFGKEPKHVFQ